MKRNCWLEDVYVSGHFVKSHFVKGRFYVHPYLYRSLADHDSENPLAGYRIQTGTDP